MVAIFKFFGDVGGCGVVVDGRWKVLEIKNCWLISVDILFN